MMMRTTAGTLSLVVALLAVSTAVSASQLYCNPQHLYLVDHASAATMTHLTASSVVRGWQADVALIVCPTAMELQIDSGVTTDAGKRNSTEDYEVLVFQRRESDGAKARASWHSAIRPSTTLRVLYRGVTVAVVASLKGSAIEYPVNAAVVPMLDTPWSPQQSSSAGSNILQKARAKLNAPDPLVETLVKAVTAESAKTFLDYLTGVSSDISTRNSIAPDGQKAADWIEATFKKYGFNTTQQPFKSGYNPNVIATLKGVSEPDKIMIVGAHYDSRGVLRESKTAVAPGANDDGSGTSMLLQLARIIHETDTAFRYTLVLGSWGGEEQGLYGSRFYAQEAKANGTDIIAMIQGDMIAYRKPGEGLQCGFPDKYADQLLTDLAIQVIDTYVPELEACYTSSCCSDHQSFYEQGFSATQFFERCGPIADDKYHNIGDVVDRTGYDIDGQLIAITKSMIATAATILEVEDGY